RPSPSPRPGWTHAYAGCLQIGASGFSTYPGLLLDAPQWPSESPEGYYLLSFRFAQDVAHIDAGYIPYAEINVPSLILVGRFSTDPHWPVLSDPRGLPQGCCAPNSTDRNAVARSEDR